MPCDDQTEELALHLDFDDRLCGFSMTKRTCAQTVGGDTLLERLRGSTATRLQQEAPESLLEVDDDWEGFVQLKQLFAIRAALGVLDGEYDAAGGAFRIESIESGPDGIQVTGSVAVDIIAAEITACGGCGCSTSTVKEAAAT